MSEAADKNRALQKIHLLEEGHHPIQLRSHLHQDDRVKGFEGFSQSFQGLRYRKDSQSFFPLNKGNLRPCCSGIECSDSRDGLHLDMREVAAERFQKID